MRMNESEIDRALHLVGQHTPRFLPYVKYLSDWRYIINKNSDGWPYWSAGVRPSDALQEPVTKLVNSIQRRGPEPSVREFDKAITPIKSFATRKNLPVPVLGDDLEGSGPTVPPLMEKDDVKFVLWVENTLVPDLKESGAVETAADFERLIEIIKKLSGS